MPPLTILDLLKKESQARSCLLKIPEGLRACSNLVSFPAGGIILRKNERIEFVYLLLKGRIKVLNAMPDGNLYSWLTMDPCTFICNLEVLTGSAVNYSRIDAVEDCVLLGMPLENFTEWLHKDIDFLWFVSTDCAGKAYRVSYDMGNGAYKSGFQKVVRYLLKYCGQYPPGEGGCTILEKTRPEIASEIGISVKTVNRSLKQLQQDGHASIRAGKVAIDAPQLAALREIWFRVSS